MISRFSLESTLHVDCVARQVGLSEVEEVVLDEGDGVQIRVVNCIVNKVRSVDGYGPSEESNVVFKFVADKHDWVSLICNVNGRVSLELGQQMAWLVLEGRKDVTEEAFCQAITVTTSRLNLASERVLELGDAFGFATLRTFAGVDVRNVHHVVAKS